MFLFLAYCPQRHLSRLGYEEDPVLVEAEHVDLLVALGSDQVDVERRGVTEADHLAKLGSPLQLHQGHRLDEELEAAAVAIAAYDASGRYGQVLEPARGRFMPLQLQVVDVLELKSLHLDVTRVNYRKQHYANGLFMRTCKSGLKSGAPILISSFWSSLTLRYRHDWNVTKMVFAKSDPDSP